MSELEIRKYAAFSYQGEGGNPAGVALVEEFPADEVMMRIAAEVGFSETVFAKRTEGGFRVRYFSPDSEVDFCGHATLALGFALFEQFGAGEYALALNHARIQVATDNEGKVTLSSPSTHSRALPSDQKARYQALFGLYAEDLNDAIPMAIGNGGNDHLVIALNSRQKLAQMAYDFEKAKVAMQQDKLVTVALLYRESAGLIHIRNAFAFGGVYEDPATGAAAAAVTGYLRDLGKLDFKNGTASIEYRQGFDMGTPCVLEVTAGEEKGGSVLISGWVRQL
ncbi:PhzF family phenazine biosynthesis protein [Bowmanella dokdonensis]|uniref:PhzF family phenazine biosynthesis protein n=1 Tax=Bowmanella dokdonensis TaxID=751969 RepID=A0A939DRM2_9ALTE|nr:PhzF family phenazine biosynthesis protein [Bowmanella dokdonensis]MBN7826960.1 PhzF family phenazine biosynthesis protein [Bowmanella dokdonensis]